MRSTAAFWNKILLLNVYRWEANKPLVDQVRYAWTLKPERGARAEYVLTVRRGLVLCAFAACKWLLASQENFSGLPDMFGTRRSIPSTSGGL